MLAETLRLRPNTLHPSHSRDKQIRCEPAAVKRMREQRVNRAVARDDRAV
jgi:hypothetical protein